MIIPGQPRRSMYGEHNTHDEQVTQSEHVMTMFQRLVDESIPEAMIASDLDQTRVRSFWMHEEGHVEREPIRVVAEVGRRIEA